MSEAFIKKLNTKHKIFSFGLSGVMTGGVPDRYYEGTKRSLWIEFKYLKKDTHKWNPDALSDLQKAWLYRAWTNNQRPHVIVGIGLNYGLIFDTPGLWLNECPAHAYADKLISINNIALYITRYCNGTR